MCSRARCRSSDRAPTPSPTIAFSKEQIADYPRRLNVKPGITGWAQVNGFRGATETDEAMRQRVEHDIFYIDNCSIGFDFYILLLTLISPKASRNAR